jgi:aryl-alcohol dehydrogenase-like predicted oxidoreductase
MRYIKLGKSGPDVSVIGQGTWAMAGNSWGNVDDEESVRAIRKAVDCGITLIDTAATYGGGHSEQVVGKALKGIRDKVVVATKCGVHLNQEKKMLEHDLSAAAIKKEAEDSMNRMGIDYIDLYQFHYPDPSTPLSESLGAMQRLKEEGKVRYIGLSNFELPLLKEAVKIATIDSLQLKYSLLDRENEELIRFCRENDIGVLTYGSIGGGMLSGKFREPPVFPENDRRAFFYPFFKEPAFGKCLKFVDDLEKIALRKCVPVAQVAINWVTQYPGVSVALVGSKTPAQSESNASAGAWELSSDEVKEINSSYDKIFKQDQKNK